MLKRNQARGQTLCSAAALCCIALAPLGAGAQTRMSVAEVTQLYTAAGFRIVNNQPVNRCGKPAKPRVTFVDINEDKRPEALFIDADAGCYAPSGRYFAVVTRDGVGWRSVISGTGAIKALSTRTAGWLDMRTTDVGCERPYRYDGRVYTAVTDCSGLPIAAAPSPARQAQPAQVQPSQPQQAQPAGSAATTTLQPADEAAAFTAAGFSKRGGVWRSGCDDPGTASYTPGRIDNVADLNGDGLPDAVISEGGTYCYGNTGQGYWLVSKLPSGSWKLMTNGTGILEFLKTKGTGGWPDVSVGGPGFCFPVERWNGRAYKLQRWEYEGKACKPQR